MEEPRAPKVPETAATITTTGSESGLRVAQAKIPLTEEQKQRIETNRRKARAIYEENLKQREAQASQAGCSSIATSITTKTATTPATPNKLKRPHSEISATISPQSLRDARNPSASNPGYGEHSKLAPLRPASTKFASFVEYDLSKMTDTKGGFLSTTDDPASAIDTRGKPENMSLEKWSQHLLRQKLKEQKLGAHAPHLSALDRGTEKEKALRKCWECGSWELDWKFYEIFRCRVCNACKERFPEKYSLLTKTECKDDYLITDPELKDSEILPHMTRPNPHKSTWNDMQLFLRYQVEARALAKWGSFEAMDVEFEKRTKEKRRKKEEKFRNKLRELKNKTRVETWKRTGNGELGADAGPRGGRHEHVWGPLLENGDGVTVRTCEDCGLEVEEIVL